MNHFIMMTHNGELLNFMFNDLKQLENVQFCNERYNINNRFLKLTNKIHTSIRVNEYFNMPCKSIWNSYDVLLKKTYCKDTTYYIVFTDETIIRYDYSILARIQSLGENIKFILLFLNPLSRPGAKKAKEIIGNFRFDLIYTFDKADAENFDFKYTECIYSHNLINGSYTEQSDLFFIGRAKDRLPLLHSIYQKLSAKGLLCRFRIIDVNKKLQKKNTNIVYNESMSYKEVIKNVMSTNCIIEVLQGIQSGMTLRTYEAFCYNKKLLTNNKKIIDSPYYNSKYISVFETIDDIDIDFIQRDEIVDYNYSGEYSPIHFIEQILCEINK